MKELASQHLQFPSTVRSGSFSIKRRLRAGCTASNPEGSILFCFFREGPYAIKRHFLHQHARSKHPSVASAIAAGSLALSTGRACGIETLVPVSESWLGPAFSQKMSLVMLEVRAADSFRNARRQGSLALYGLTG